MISHRTKQMLIFLTSTLHKQGKLPFENSALFVVWGPLKLERLVCLLSRSSVPYLNLIGNACWVSLKQTPQFIYFRNLGSHKLYSASGSEWSWHLPPLVWPPLTLARCVSGAGPASEQGQQNEGWVCPARRRPEWSELCGCVGWGPEGGEWRTDLELTVQLLQQVWLVLGAQRQLCFSRNSR